MSALEFYARVAISCDVLGAGVGDSPDSWEAALGDDCLNVPGRGMLRRDHGLVEINFAPDQLGRMSCVGFGVKTHRLLRDHSPQTVPAPLSQRYGTFARRLRYEELEAAVLAAGRVFELEDEPRDVRRYRVPESRARVTVIADPDPYGTGDLDPHSHRAGDVWSVDVW